MTDGYDEHSHDEVNAAMTPVPPEVVAADQFQAAQGEIEPCLDAMAALYGWPMVTPVAQVLRNVQATGDGAYRELWRLAFDRKQTIISLHDEIARAHLEIQQLHEAVRGSVPAAEVAGLQAQVAGLQAQVAELEKLLRGAGRTPAWVNRTVRRAERVGRAATELAARG